MCIAGKKLFSVFSDNPSGLFTTCVSVCVSFAFSGVGVNYFTLTSNQSDFPIVEAIKTLKSLVILLSACRLNSEDSNHFSSCFPPT